MTRYLLEINISRDEWLKRYRLQANYVRCQTIGGVKVKIHVKYLQKFVTHSGIQGVFELELGENQNFVAIHQRN